jgi:3-deoxy-D-manno-octulosonate 8-phosphate phosphatase (KDO 8-P phosphatase)
MSFSAEERARRVKVILFDVDGVLTDGTIWVYPMPVSHPDGSVTTQMVEAKGFSAHDGAGMTLARLGGMKLGVITKRISETVAVRMKDLKIEYVYQGEAFKMRPVREIMEKEGIGLDEIAYVGDDVVDLPVMRQCGLAIATANARPQVKNEAQYVTTAAGGYGAGRDAIEFILTAKGILEKCLEASVDEHNPLPPSMDIGKGGDLK